MDVLCRGVRPRLLPPVPDSLSLLADGHRWRLLQELGQSDRRVGELVDLLEAPQSLVSYHLGQLRAAGLVTSRRSTADGRDTYYTVDLARCGDALCSAGAALQPGLRLAIADPPVPAVPATAARRVRVLFLCTGNSARSQMAEAFLRARGGDAVDVRSAGSHPKPFHPDAVRVMAERGIDIAGHQAKHLRRFARMRFDHVVTLCDRVREVCPEFPGHPHAVHWSIADPSVDGDYPAFVRTADDIETRVAFFAARLAAHLAANPKAAHTKEALA